MKCFNKIEEVKKEISARKDKKATIGFVPTMGCLHEGHLSLVRKSVKECAYSVVSIFVNPSQFGQGEDYLVYPKTLKKDISLLKKEGVDLIFNPEVKEMYEKNFLAWVNVDELSKRLEGVFRQEHFRGVTTIVLKLLNIVMPDKAYFGWKDAQQLVIIKKMVKDLNVSTDIIGLATVREKDGLAASSRNIYLNKSDREKALCLSKSLQKMKGMVEYDGVFETAVLLKEGNKILREYPDIEVQYLEAVNLEKLKPVRNISKNTMIAGAIRIGKVRLIDNVIFL